MPLFRALPFLTLLLMMTGLSRADAETMPFSPFTAHYRGEANGMSVSDLGSRKLISLGQERYRIEYDASAMIYRLEEQSEFLWQAGQPRPGQARPGQPGQPWPAKCLVLIISTRT